MWLAFVDETSDTKYKDYFGLSVALVNATFYPNIKREAQHILIEGGWDPNIEFKGSFLFSASKGCASVPVNKRIELASDLLELNASNKNRRMKFYYVKMTSGNHKEDYLKYLPLLLKKGLPKASPKSGKDLFCLTCDKRADIQASEVHNAIRSIVNQRGYVIFEEVSMATSGFNTVGLLYADIVGYLMSRIDNISRDADLFDSIPQECFETDGRVKKLKSSASLISKINRLSLFEVRRE
jgi:hypothetical protein